MSDFVAPISLRLDSHGDHRRVANHCANTARGQLPRLRIALYSHDTMGLGHLRRNLLIADALSRAPLNATNLLVTGAHEANFFELPQGVDCLTLPRMRKDGAGDYRPSHLAISTNDLTHLRASTIESALRSFEPDLLIVDKVPLGPFDELKRVLESLKQTGRTRCVLGLRDILDSPATVARQWATKSGRDAIDRFYEQVWIYGDQNVFDPVKSYSLGARIASKVRFLGYLDQSRRLDTASKLNASGIEGIPIDRGGLNVCTLGGGQDGYPVAEAFLMGLPHDLNTTSVLLTGPFMPECEFTCLCRLAATIPNVFVRRFVPEADWLIQRADRVVAMAGYNTVCSILAFEKRALLVPRVTPRQEQAIRASCLEKLGLVDVLPSSKLTPAAINHWLRSEDTRNSSTRQVVDLRGLQRIKQLVIEMSTTCSPTKVNGRATK